MTTISVPTLELLCEQQLRWISLAENVQKLRLEKYNNHFDYWLDIIETFILGRSSTRDHFHSTYGWKFSLPHNVIKQSHFQDIAKRVISTIETGFDVKVNLTGQDIHSFEVSIKGVTSTGFHIRTLPIISRTLHDNYINTNPTITV